MTKKLGFVDYLKYRFSSDRKFSEARAGLSQQQIGQAVTTPATYEGFSKEGYQKNVTAYRCISMIAQACAGINIELYNKRKGGEPTEILEHELLTLLNKPNALESGYSFKEGFFSYFLLTGNGMIEMAKLGGNRAYNKSKPTELWHVRPDRIKIIVGKKGYPKEYRLTVDSAEKVWEFDPIKLKSNLIHMKSFNPTDLWWGQSPLQAAIYALDQANESDKFNIALTQNQCVPSAVIQVNQNQWNPTGALPDDLFDQLKDDIERNYSGVRNARKPVVLEGGLTWTQIGFSPQEMSFIENKKITAADIATVYGVPLELLGLGQKTFNNYAEARQAFYEEVVLPLMDSYVEKLNNEVVPLFGDNLLLKVNMDDIEALAYKREAKFKSVQSADFLTVNEKRAAAGYEPLAGWDVLMINGQPATDPEDLEVNYDFGDITNEPADDEDPKDPEANADDDEDDADPKSDDENDKPKRAEWKSFNLINKIERVNTWKRQNARRDRLALKMNSEVYSVFRSFSSDIKKILMDGGSKQMVDIKIQKRLEKFSVDLEPVVANNIKLTIRNFSDNIFQGAKDAGLVREKKSGSSNFNSWATIFTRTATAKAITEITGVTQSKVERVVQKIVENGIIDGSANSELVNELMDNFDTISKGRARTIARTEVGTASNYANLNAARDLEIPNLQKEWVSMDDARVRDGGKDGNGANHEKMNGQRVDLDDSFNVPPDQTMDGPQDTGAPADQVINCRCVLIFMAK